MEPGIFSEMDSIFKDKISVGGIPVPVHPGCSIRTTLHFPDKQFISFLDSQSKKVDRFSKIRWQINGMIEHKKKGLRNGRIIYDDTDTIETYSTQLGIVNDEISPIIDVTAQNNATGYYSNFISFLEHSEIVTLLNNYRNNTGFVQKIPLIWNGKTDKGDYYRRNPEQEYFLLLDLISDPLLKHRIVYCYLLRAADVEEAVKVNIIFNQTGRNKIETLKIVYKDGWCKTMCTVSDTYLYILKDQAGEKLHEQYEKPDGIGESDIPFCPERDAIRSCPEDRVPPVVTNPMIRVGPAPPSAAASTADWVCKTSRTTGRKFWYNRVNGETKNYKPPGAGDCPDPIWECIRNESDGTKKYVDRSSARYEERTVKPPNMDRDKDCDSDWECLKRGTNGTGIWRNKYTGVEVRERPPDGPECSFTMRSDGGGDVAAKPGEPVRPSRSDILRLGRELELNTDLPDRGSQVVTTRKALVPQPMQWCQEPPKGNKPPVFINTASGVRSKQIPAGYYAVGIGREGLVYFTKFSEDGVLSPQNEVPQDLKRVPRCGYNSTQTRSFQSMEEVPPGTRLPVRDTILPPQPPPVEKTVNGWTCVVDESGRMLWKNNITKNTTEFQPTGGPECQRPHWKCERDDEGNETYVDRRYGTIRQRPEYVAEECPPKWECIIGDGGKRYWRNIKSKALFSKKPDDGPDCPKPAWKCIRDQSGNITYEDISGGGYGVMTETPRFIAEPCDSEWECRTSRTTGRKYWFNTRTEEATADQPEGAPECEDVDIWRCAVSKKGERIWINFPGTKKVRERPEGADDCPQPEWKCQFDSDGNKKYVDTSLGQYGERTQEPSTVSIQCPDWGCTATEKGVYYYDKNGIEPATWIVPYGARECPQPEWECQRDSQGGIYYKDANDNYPDVTEKPDTFKECEEEDRWECGISRKNGTVVWINQKGDRVNEKPLNAPDCPVPIWDCQRDRDGKPFYVDRLSNYPNRTVEPKRHMGNVCDEEVVVAQPLRPTPPPPEPLPVEAPPRALRKTTPQLTSSQREEASRLAGEKERVKRGVTSVGGSVSNRIKAFSNPKEYGLGKGVDTGIDEVKVEGINPMFRKNGK